MHLQTVSKILSSKAKTIFQAMLMSDLHLEYTDDNFLKFPVVAPILMLAGDIGRPDIPSLQKFLLDQCQRFEHIFYVAGNHCFYEENLHDHCIIIRSDLELKRTHIIYTKCRIWCTLPSSSSIRSNFSLRINGDESSTLNK